MKNFKKPYKLEDKNGVRFVLYNGNKTKSVFGALEFDESLGVFPIINNKNQIVEFMDCMGNFTKKPTRFAHEFNKYINATGKGVCYGYPVNNFFDTALIDLPSKYLTSNEIRRIVQNEERYKIRLARKHGEFVGLLENIRYRIYVLKIYKQKLDRAKKLILKDNNKHNFEDLYFNL